MAVGDEYTSEVADVSVSRVRVQFASEAADVLVVGVTVFAGDVADVDVGS